MKNLLSLSRSVVTLTAAFFLIFSSAIVNAQIETQEVSADEFADGNRYLNRATGLTPPIVLDGGLLIDGTGGPTLENARIVINQDRIEAIGRGDSVAIPDGAEVIDVSGKVVMPGLVDAHAHYRLFLPELMITHGITTQIDTGNYMDYPTTIRDLIAAGKLWGNRVFTSGSGITGDVADDLPKRDRFRVKSPEEARMAAEIHVRRGVDFIKVYDELTADQLQAITEVAHDAGLKVVGHIGAMDAREAALAGIDGLIHGLGISAALVTEAESLEMKRNLGGYRQIGEKANPWGTPGGGAFHWNMDESKYDDLINLLVERNVMIQPDIVHSTKGVLPQWNDRFSHEYQRLFEDNPGLHYIADNVKHNWLSTDYLDGETTEDLQRRRLGLEKFQDFIIRFHRAGGLLLAGSDTQGSAAAGITLHQEMEVFVDMGLTPMEALLTATKNPAEFYLPGKGIGVLQAGNLADILVLNANPLENIRNTREIDSVMVGGKFMEMGYHMPYEDPLRELFIKTAPSPYRHLYDESTP